MKYRKLRIAWSVAWGLLAVLLCVLWVRSYFRFDQIIHRASATNYVAVSTLRGQVAIGGSDDASLAQIFKRDWMHREFSLKGWDLNRGSPFAVFPASTPRAILMWPQFNDPFYIGPPGSANYELTIPYWLLAFGSAALGTLPWLRWRYSLRTLLIATTLVAVILGLIVYALRR